MYERLAFLSIFSRLQVIENKRLWCWAVTAEWCGPPQDLNSMTLLLLAATQVPDGKFEHNWPIAALHITVEEIWK